MSSHNIYKIRDILVEEAKDTPKIVKKKISSKTLCGVPDSFGAALMLPDLEFFFLIRIRPNISVTKIILFKIARRSKGHFSFSP